MASSPAARRLSSTPSSKHSQLTGFPRRIKDAAADVHNCVQKWEKLKNQGFKIVSDIANLKISQRTEQEESCYPAGLHEWCTNLRSTYSDMTILADKLKTISRQLEKVSEIHANSSDILFLSWPTDKFQSVAEEISGMYSQELEAKRLIAENIAHIDWLEDGVMREAESSRDLLMAYVACWLHEPYINEETRTMLLEELLLETGHQK